MTRPYLFTADLHLGSDDEEEESRKEATFVSFLDHAREHAAGLVVLGDLFDFWFPYRHAIPRRAVRLLGRMAELRESGFALQFIGGNHDFWITGFMEDELGIPARRPTLSLSVGGRQIFAAHGDDLVAAGDPGYRFLKRALHNRGVQRLIQLIHPDLAMPLARRFSKMSREAKGTGDFVLRQSLNSSLEAAFDKGHDAVIMGHLHQAQHLRLDRGECLILGGWTGRLSFVSAHDGTLQLGEWPPAAGSL